MSKLMKQLAEEGRKARAAKNTQPTRPPAIGKWGFLNHEPHILTIKNNNAIYGSRSDLVNAAEAITESMCWDETTEGEEFWSWVYNRLHFYASTRS